MDRHRSPARSLQHLAAAALLYATGARADWPDFTTATPRQAAEAVANAAIERMEATFAGEFVQTNYWFGCHEGSPIAPLIVRTNRTYANAVIDELLELFGRESVRTPLMVVGEERRLNSTNLIQIGVQTQKWTNASGQVFTTNYPLWRVDDRHVTTNGSCNVYTSTTARVIWTNAPPNYLPQPLLAAIDAGISKCANGGYFLDHHKATAGSFENYMATPISTNWEWVGESYEDGTWVKTGSNYPSAFPQMTAVKAMQYSGAGAVITNTEIYDRGTTPIPGPPVWGWTVGAMTTYTMPDPPPLPRYLTTDTVRAFFTASTNVAGTVLRRTATSRGQDYEFWYEARGFGGGLDGLYDASPTGALAAAFWNYKRKPGNQPPYGCWEKTVGGITTVAELVPPARWYTTEGPDLAPGFGSLQDQALDVYKPPCLRVRSMTTSEVACAGCPEPAAFPHPIEVTIVGRYWLPAMPTQSLLLITATQRMTVSSAGDITLAYPFTRIDTLAATDTVWNSGTYYAKDGVQLAVVYTNPSKSYRPLSSAWNRSPSATFVHFRKAMEERRDFIKELRWTRKPVGWFTNVTRQAWSRTESTDYTYSYDYSDVTGDDDDPVETITEEGDNADLDCEDFGTPTISNQLEPEWYIHDILCTKYRLYESRNRTVDVDGEGELQIYTHNTISDVVHRDYEGQKQRQTADAYQRWSDRIPADIDFYTRWAVSPSNSLTIDVDTNKIICAPLPDITGIETGVHHTNAVARQTNPFQAAKKIETKAKSRTSAVEFFTLAPNADAQLPSATGTLDFTDTHTLTCTPAGASETRTKTSEYDATYSRASIVLDFKEQVARWQFDYP